MRPHIVMATGLLALGLAGGPRPAEAQYAGPAGAPAYAPYAPGAPGYPHSDHYQADRPAYPYGPSRYGQHYGPGYSRPTLPEDPPFGIFPPGYGPTADRQTYRPPFDRQTYRPPFDRQSYRPPFAGPAPGVFPGFGTEPGAFPGFGTAPGPGFGPGPRPTAPGGSAQLLGLADTLLGQVDGFLQSFTSTARDVPETQQFIGDAQALGAAAGRFRQLAASGLPPGPLSQELLGLEGAWGQLQQRTQRIARGRTGPNIQRVEQMGETLRQMRLVLP